LLRSRTVEKQIALCSRYGAPYHPSPATQKVGIAANVRKGLLPINGLRLAPDAGTTGWFIWAGDVMSEDEDFFLPLHVTHLEDWCPQVVRFLGLPPGWRFLVAGDYEDVWADPSLLDGR
jgi:hypothetical protein